MKRRGFLLLGVALSAVLLAWTLREVRLEEFVLLLRQTDPWWLALGGLFYFVAVVLRTWRWGILLRGLRSTRFRERFVALTIGYMGNNIYPARAGELLRSYVLQRRCGLSISAILATIVVERVLDGLMVVFLGMTALLFSPLPPSLRPGVIAAGIVFGGTFLVLLAVARISACLRLRIEQIFRRKAKAGSRIEQVLAFAIRFLDGLTALRNSTQALAVGGLTVLIWLAEAGTYALVMLGFPFRTSFFSLLVVTAAVNLATALPSAPGYLGAFEAPGVAVLQAFGVPAGSAFTYMVLLHFVVWLPITALGFLLFLLEGLRGVVPTADIPSHQLTDGP